ncbi:MAG: hypothetical protein EHM59_04445 [Betaproteobacteria bacterium]|nr:MAG: hypothetical protein EHM59_04445 [Betaproteobacteria bacterium]
MGRQLSRLLALQGAITTVIAGGIFVWGNFSNGIAALLGGAAAAVAALAYGVAHWLQGAGGTGKLLRIFLVAELSRVGTAVVLLGLGMANLPGEAAIAYLVAFAAALLAYLLVFLF